MENKTAVLKTNIGQNYDSEFCGSIPLNFVNLIQPHGLLLVLDKQELRIVQASDNVHDFFGVPTEQVLDQHIASYLSAAQYEDMATKIMAQESHHKVPLNLDFTLNDKQYTFTALLHAKDMYVLVELEKVSEATAPDSFTGMYQQIKFVTSLLKQADTLVNTAQIGAAEIKKLTNLDRVLVYQFDPNWNGVVIAQAKEAFMDDYLGLRFPASDVPKQARELYLSNPYRLIPNRTYTPVRLKPVLNPVTLRFTDLADCNLRSVAGVHLEYMATLHAMASMSLPLIVDDKLWGLISCHHQTPFYPNYELRSALELLSGIISAQIAAKEKQSAIQLTSDLQSIHAQLLEQVYSCDTLADALLNSPVSIKDLLSLSGAVLLYDGEMHTSGLLPDAQSIKDMVFWLRRMQGNDVFVTDNLSEHYRQSIVYMAKVSGLIVLPINAEQGEFILGFRPEVLQTVHWGGNPEQAIQIEADGKTYHPRNSFEAYKETVKYTAEPWHAAEIAAAKTLRQTVLEKIIKDRH